MRRVAFDPHPSVPLAPQLQAALEPLLGRPVDPAEVAQLLAQGSVFRNRRRYKDPGPPGAGPVVEVFWPELPVAEFTLDPRSIVWQDEHLLVVDKPPGIHTAPSPFSDIDCLTWGVQKYLATGYEVHAVHRLDRDAQGLMFFPKHKEAEKALHRMFRERRVRKVYEAETPALRDEPRQVYRWRDVLTYQGRDQAAATTALLSGIDARGHLRWTVLPHTGRTHQIRRHFARYLVPLWGDPVYAPGVYPSSEPLGLACVAYRCRHPVTGERLDFRRKSRT